MHAVVGANTSDDTVDACAEYFASLVDDTSASAGADAEETNDADTTNDANDVPETHESDTDTNVTDDEDATNDVEDTVDANESEADIGLVNSTDVKASTAVSPKKLLQNAKHRKKSKSFKRK